uniref:Calponin-homology (CH) domain-containing protein n=1 Tax=Trichuris muris TaxID=70415 RepID=A0A5S6R569_TRIMR
MAIVSGAGDGAVSGSCLSRCLEKVFEDAQLSGALHLCERNLKTFPFSVGRYDLTDLVVVDVSRNRLLDFPVELCECGFLETLYLRSNCVKVVPNCIASLTSLTFLDLSYNQISSLPAGLCVLPLEVLLLKSNRVESLPTEITKLAATLTELDVSCNRLSSLPSEIGALYKLRVLNLRQNVLTWLPYDFCKLRLRYCDISFNKICQLDTDIRLMRSLIDISLEGNPLVFPLAKLCNRGRDHIFKVLEAEASGRSRRQRLSADLEAPQQPPALLPTNPSDYKYLVRERADRRKVRSRTVATDSGYSTLSEENARALVECFSKPQRSDEAELPNRAVAFVPPLCAGKASTEGGSLVDEVMSAYMERLNASQPETAEIDGHAERCSPAPAGAKGSPRAPAGTPKSVKSEVIQALYTTGTRDVVTAEMMVMRTSCKTATVPVDANEIRESNQNVLTNAPTAVCASPLCSRRPADTVTVTPRAASEATVKTARRLIYTKAQQVASPSTKAQKMHRRASLRACSLPEDKDGLAEVICNMLEQKLKIDLPRSNDALADALSDGVVLCRFLNAIRPRTVAVVHVPTDTSPCVPLAKARRNLENFLTGCRRLGVQEVHLFSILDLMEKRNLHAVSRALQAIGRQVNRPTRAANAATMVT